MGLNQIGYQEFIFNSEAVKDSSYVAVIIANLRSDDVPQLFDLSGDVRTQIRVSRGHCMLIVSLLKPMALKHFHWKVLCPRSCSCD